MPVAHLDCAYGISGDMLVGAGVSAGVPLDRINRALEKLRLGIQVESHAVERAGVRAVRVVTVGGGAAADHESQGKVAVSHSAPGTAHAHSHGHAHGHSYPVSALAPPAANQAQLGESEPSHPHAPERAGREPHAHAEHARTVTEILGIVGAAGLPQRVERLARKAFELLAGAEAAVHGAPPQNVHFHEVGQDDAIADVVSAAVVVEELCIERLTCSALNVGEGSIECAHGQFGVPAPATLELLRGVPIYSTGIRAELVTPTGAALVRAIAQQFGPMPPMRPTGYGYGAGSYTSAGADVLRLILGEPAESTLEAGEARSQAAGVTRVTVIEANVDDMNPQLFGFLMERAMAAGAIDVYGVPAHMKKNRPGLLISVLARPQDADRLARLLLEETTTIGLRHYEVERTVLQRECVKVETAFGPIRVKVAQQQGRVLNVAPEYEDCREAALRSGKPFKTVHEEALRAYRARDSSR